jgi:steroid delta-isomerase-like uncharacterized protein
MSENLSAKEIGRAWFEGVWNARNPDAARELMAPDALGYLEGGGIITGPDEFLKFQQSYLESVPDMMIEIMEIMADEENVCVQWRAGGTHSGRGLGFEPTGRKVSFRGITWFHIQKGKIVEGRDFWNMGGLMQLMSGTPPPATI